jgi:cation transporter-like permease
MDDLRRTTVAAVVLSFTLVCMLLVFAMSAAQQPKAEAGSLVLLAAVLVLTYSTIFQWIRCAKRYIDHAIDRTLAREDEQGPSRGPGQP